MNEAIVSYEPGELSVLSAVYWWGIAVIKLIQQIETPQITEAVRYLTHLGLGYIYFPVVLFVFWCVDEKQGMRLGLFLLFSTWSNAFCKTLFQQPRPYQLDASVGRAIEKTYGFPSGHAQISLTFFVPLARWLGETRHYGRLGRRMLLAGALVFCLFIGWTRLYLGVHFPTDVLAGWLLGAFLLAGYILLVPRIERFLAEGGRRFQIICAASVSWLMLFSGVDCALPGLYFGFSAGYCLLRGAFHARGVTKSGKPAFLLMGMRFFFGMAGAAFVYLVLKLLLPGISPLYDIHAWPGGISSYSQIARFAHYGAVGLWAGAGAPLFFMRLFPGQRSK